MRRIKVLASIILLSLTSLFFSRCSTEVDIYADWEDITVVYALLNQNDSVHYLRISKCFLGEGNALLMAVNPDSNYYNVSDISVSVEEYITEDDEFPVNIFYADTITKDKDVNTTQYFGDKQLLYYFEANLNSSSIYKVVIHNEKTGKYVTATTELVGPLYIQKPDPIQRISLTNAISPFTFKFTSAEYGRTYDLLLRYYYKEKDIASGTTVEKHVDWFVGSKEATSLDGNQSMEFDLYGQDFFTNLADNIEVDLSKELYAGPMEFILAAGADDLYTYMSVNEPVSSINTNKPEFTNVTNGIGVFSSRYDNSKDNPRINYMSYLTIDSLYNGSITGHLNFVGEYTR